MDLSDFPLKIVETVEKMGVKNEMIVNHNFCLQQFIYNHLEVSFYMQVEFLLDFQQYFLIRVFVFE